MGCIPIHYSKKVSSTKIDIQGIPTSPKNGSWVAISCFMFSWFHPCLFQSLTCASGGLSSLEESSRYHDKKIYPLVI